MCSPCPEAGRLHYHPVAFSDGIDPGAEGDNLETAFIAGDGAGLGGAEEGGEGWFGGVDTLDLVYVGGVDGGCEGAEEQSVCW